MSANNGDKSRFHRERKKKLRARQRIRALKKGPVTEPAKSA